MCEDKDLEDIEYCEGEHTQAGFYDEAYIIKLKDILTFPKFANETPLTVPETAILTAYGTLTNSEKALTLLGDIKLKTGKKMYRFPVITDTGGLEYSRVKEDSKAVKTDYMAKLQLTTHNRGVLGDLMNCLVILRPVDGPMQLLGRPGKPAKITEEKGKNGKSSDAERAIDVKFSTQPFHAVDYRGVLQLTPAL